MGQIISYYVLNDEELDLLLNAGDDFESVLMQKILNFHEVDGQPFWKSHLEFGQGVKAWNPMLEVLFKLDDSENGVLRKSLSEILKRDVNFCVLDELNVANIWKGLKQISVSKIEEALSDHDMVEHFKRMKGYRTSSLEKKEIILIEFIELFNAMYKAQQLHRKVLVKLD